MTKHRHKGLPDAKPHRKQPEDYASLFRLALTYYESKHYAESLRMWNRAKQAARGQPKPNLYLNIGCVHEKVGNKRLAIHNYKKELEITPLSRQALYNLGNLYYELHRYRHAVGYLESCYALKHSVDEIVDRLAHSYFMTGQVERELQLYESFLKDNPRDVWCLNNLGALLMNGRHYHRACLYLRRALAEDPEDSTVKRNLDTARKLVRNARRCPTSDRLRSSCRKDSR